MNPSIPLEIHQIVTTYMRFNVRNRRGDEIHDTSSLPWPKQEIIDACLKYLELEENPNIRGSIRGSLLQLSCYQDEVGDEPFRNCRFDLFPMDLNSLGDAEIAGVESVVAIQLRHLDAGRFIDLLRRVQSEFKLLDQVCDKIEKHHCANGR